MLQVTPQMTEVGYKVLEVQALSFIKLYLAPWAGFSGLRGANACSEIRVHQEALLCLNRGLPSGWCRCWISHMT